MHGQQAGPAADSSKEPLPPPGSLCSFHSSGGNTSLYAPAKAITPPASKPVGPGLVPSRPIFQRHCICFQPVSLGTSSVQSECLSSRRWEAPDCPPEGKKGSHPQERRASLVEAQLQADVLLHSGCLLPLFSMGSPTGRALPFFLILVHIYLHGALSQTTGPVGQRKPFFERLRRLEEQVSAPTV